MELILINKRLFGLITAVCVIGSMVGCDIGGDSGESSVREPSPIVSTRGESSAETESSQVSAPIEQSGEFTLIGDPENEVIITANGNSVTFHGKSRNISGISYIDSSFSAAEVPIELTDEGFTGTITCSARKNTRFTVDIILNDEFVCSYQMKYNKESKSLELVVPMDVLQQNISVTENPPILAPALVKRYVTTEENGDVNAILERIRALSNEICEGLDSDYDKLRAISRWVSDNIYYDYPAHDAGIPEECLSLEYMLNNRSSVCGGYANMTSALCAAQGIKCYNIKGHALQGDATYEDVNVTEAYHEWNFAVIDGRVIWVDSGWNSYNYYRSSGEYDYGGIGYKYFDIGAEAFSQDHRCDSAEYRDFYKLLEG